MNNPNIHENKGINMDNDPILYFHSLFSNRSATDIALFFADVDHSTNFDFSNLKNHIKDVNAI